MSDRYARAAAATGIFTVVLVIVAFLVQPKPPSADASAAEFLTYVVDHHKALHVVQLIFGASMFFFFWFIGAVRSILGGAEGGQGRLATTAYGGGLVAGGALIVSLAMYATAALHPAANGPDVTHALIDASTMVLAISAPAVVVFFVANGLSILRTGFLPAWLAWLAFAAALFNALGIGNVFTDHGAFASDGVLGFMIGFLLFLIWFVAASILLVRKLGEAQPATAT
jgi:phosphatidylglycerophosphatase A